jgi:hypothetical protein
MHGRRLGVVACSAVALALTASGCGQSTFSADDVKRAFARHHLPLVKEISPQKIVILRFAGTTVSAQQFGIAVFSSVGDAKHYVQNPPPNGHIVRKRNVVLVYPNLVSAVQIKRLFAALNDLKS